MSSTSAAGYWRRTPGSWRPRCWRGWRRGRGRDGRLPRGGVRLPAVSGPGALAADVHGPRRRGAPLRGPSRDRRGLAVLDADRFISCSHDKTLRLWGVESGAELRRFDGHEGPVFCLVRLDRHRVLSGSADKTIRLWDIETGRELRRFTGHEGGVTCLALSDGCVLSGGSEDKTLRLWDLDTGQELRRIALAVETRVEHAQGAIPSRHGWGMRAA